MQEISQTVWRYLLQGTLSFHLLDDPVIAAHSNLEAALALLVAGPGLEAWSLGRRTGNQLSEYFDWPYQQ